MKRLRTMCVSLRKVLGERFSTVRNVWDHWKRENPQLTDGMRVNNGYCCEFAFDILRSIPQAELWGNFEEGFSHVFVKIGNLYYDAECIDGVSDWRDLPIWDRESLLHRRDMREASHPTTLQEICSHYGFDYLSAIEYLKG